MVRVKECVEIVEVKVQSWVMDIYYEDLCVCVCVCLK